MGLSLLDLGLMIKFVYCPALCNPRCAGGEKNKGLDGFTRLDLWLSLVARCICTPGRSCIKES